MSNRALTWARQSRGLSPTQKFVLLLLADSANEDGVCWPAAKSLAADSGLTDRAVRTALHDLLDVGAIRGVMRSGVRPLWTLAVEPGGTVFVAKRKQVPLPERKEVPLSERKEVPLSRELVADEKRNHVPSKAEPRSVEAEGRSAEPSRTLIEPFTSLRDDAAPFAEAGQAEPCNGAADARGAVGGQRQPQLALHAMEPPSVGPAQPAPDARTVLFREGLARLVRLTGRSPNGCRSLLGKLLATAHDDCALLSSVLFEAETLRAADPVAWVVRALQARQGLARAGSPARSSLDWLLDDPSEPPAPAWAGAIIDMKAEEAW